MLDEEKIVNSEDAQDTVATSEIENIASQNDADQDVTEDNSDNDGKDYEDICYICRRPEHITGKMIHIHGGIALCNDCMQRTFDTMTDVGFNMKDIPSGKMPNISMIDLSDLSGLFGGMPPHMDGMTGGIPNSQRLKKKKKLRC